jgi:hypothetical protein
MTSTEVQLFLTPVIAGLLFGVGCFIVVRLLEEREMRRSGGGAPLPPTLGAWLFALAVLAACTLGVAAEWWIFRVTRSMHGIDFATNFALSFFAAFYLPQTLRLSWQLLTRRRVTRRGERVVSDTRG